MVGRTGVQGALGGLFDAPELRGLAGSLSSRDTIYRGLDGFNLKFTLDGYRKVQYVSNHQHDNDFGNRRSILSNAERTR